MADLILGVGAWLGISLVAAFMFALGAALGRRGAWEEGYQLGLRVGEAWGRRHLPRGSHRERQAG